jgi:uncharacterized protein (UPF0332 family)
VLDEIVSISVELRIEKARKCLQAAEVLLASEAYADSANRSYYAIFHAMQAVLTTAGFSAKTHSGSIAEFQKSYVKTGVFAKLHSDILMEAFKVRNKSDYDIHYIVVKSEVVGQLENAKTFLSAVEAYIKTLQTEQTEQLSIDAEAPK